MKKICIYSVVFLLLDQIVKLVTTNLIDLGESVAIIKSFFYLTYVRNTGAAWSIFEGYTVLLIIVSFVAIFLVYYFMLKDKKIDKIEEIGYGMLLGGIIGNLIDRIAYGYVRDFFHFTFGNYQFPIFNVADIGIVIGTFIIIFIMVKEDFCGNTGRN